MRAWATSLISIKVPCTFVPTCRKNFHVCSVWANRSKGFTAFTYDKQTSLCERGFGTCMRDNGTDAKEVWQSHLVSKSSTNALT